MGAEAIVSIAFDCVPRSRFVAGLAIGFAVGLEVEVAAGGANLAILRYSSISS
jgi:hypothetical protein